MSFPWGKFCEPDEDSITHHPWNKGGFRYATDHRIAVRVPCTAIDSTPPEHAKFPGIDSVFELELKKQHPLVITLPESPQCTQCKGTGTFKVREQCDECRGRGGEYCPHCQEKINCKECGGSGSFLITQDCPTCCDALRTPITDRIHIAPKYVALLLGLGVATVTHSGDQNDPVLFHANCEGEAVCGLIMPRSTEGQIP